MSLSRDYPSFDLRRSFFPSGNDGELLFRELYGLVFSSRDLRNSVMDEFNFYPKVIYNTYDGTTYNSTVVMASVKVDKFYENSLVEIKITGNYTHSNNSSIEVYFGTSNSVSDSKIIDIALTSSTLFVASSNITKVSDSAGKYFVSQYIPTHSFSGSSTNITTNIDYTATQFFTVRFVAGSGSTFDLYSINATTLSDIT